MNIRRLNVTEIDDALKLIWDVFLKFEAPDYTDEGIKAFKDSIDNPNFIGKMEFFGAFKDNELIGVISTREKHHISLLFVKEDNQGQGVGKSLFQYIVKLNNDNFMTVNSSLYAKEFYERLGFTCVAREQCEKGIRYYPMILKK